MKLLLVEDEPDLLASLVSYLRAQHYVCEVAITFAQAQEKMLLHSYECIVLDLTLPGGDGLDLLRALQRLKKPAGVIITSARAAVDDRITGLELGADDYLAKPFSMMELVARVKALLRRVDAMARNLKMDAGSLSSGGLSIDPITREAALDGRQLDLTPREFDLLYFFVRQPGKVFSRLDLLNSVWGYNHEGYEHTVNTHINRLRAKIEADPAQPLRILTVWGRGYKFAQPGEAA